MKAGVRVSCSTAAPDCVPRGTDMPPGFLSPPRTRGASKGPDPFLTIRRGIRRFAPQAQAPGAARTLWCATTCALDSRLEGNDATERRLEPAVGEEAARLFVRQDGGAGDCLVHARMGVRAGLTS